MTIRQLPISDELKAALLTKAMLYDDLDLLKRYDKPGTHFSKAELEPTSKLSAQIIQWLASFGLEPHVVRLHKWEPTDCCQSHIDDAFPGCDTVILNLFDINNRLIINDAPAPKSDAAFLLPEGTPHAVTTGVLRYTFVAWVKKIERAKDMDYRDQARRLRHLADGMGRAINDFGSQMDPREVSAVQKRHTLLLDSADEFERLATLQRSPHIPPDYYFVSADQTLVSKHELQALRRRAQTAISCERGELHYWQGDGQDFPNSLACPVVMSADTLRELLAKKER